MIYKLEKITRNIVDGVHGDCEPEDNSGYFFISVKDMQGDRIDYSNARQISKRAYIEANKRTKLENGDVLFANTGDTIGKMLLATSESVELCKTTFQKSIALFKPNIDFVTVDYFYYLIMSNRLLLKKAAVGSGQKNLLLSDIRSFIVEIIDDKAKQKEVVRYIKAIDRKIQLNNAINTELEKVAKTIYNYWFVQFDFPNAKGKPYRTSGGKMEYNEVLKREIPKGWKIKQLKEICRFKSGYPFSSKSYLKNGKFGLITIKNVQEDGVNLNVDSFLDAIPENMPDYCLLHPGDILMSLTGNVGRVGLMFENDCLLNQRVAVIQPVSETVKGYCYFLLKSDYIRAIVDNMASGSSQANLSPIDTENILLPFDSKVISDYDAKITPIVQHIVSLKMQNKELTGLRDFLLPLLMNGQVRVRDDNKKSPNDKDSLNHG